MEKTEKLKMESLEKNLNIWLTSMHTCLDGAKKLQKEGMRLENGVLEELKTNLLGKTIEIETTEFTKLQKITGQLQYVNYRTQEVFLIFLERKPFNSGSYKISYIKSIKIIK